MLHATVVLLHGYGVRSAFWEPAHEVFQSHFEDVLVPDIEMNDLRTMLDWTASYVTERAGEIGKPVYLVGHSLGGALAAVTAARLGLSVVAGFAAIAAPYGDRHVSALLRFLIRYRLIPGFLARGRFFSDLTPKHVQKRMFATAVPETPELQDALFAPRYFHTDMLTAPAAQPAIVIASACDRVTAAAQSSALAHALGASLHEFGAEREVNHNDYIGSPEICEEVASLLESFFAAGPSVKT